MSKEEMSHATVTKHYINGKIQAVHVVGFEGTVLQLVELISEYDQEAAAVANCTCWRPTDGSAWFYTDVWDAYLESRE